MTQGKEARVRLAFNSAIRKRVDNYVKEFGRDGLEIGYVLQDVGGRLISILFTVSWYRSPMPHPNEALRSFNFDIDNAKELSLDDLFKKDVDYSERLQKYVGPALEKELAKEGLDDLFGLPEELTVFTLTETSIVFPLPNERVGPVPGGSYPMAVAYSELADMIDPHGPLRSFSK